ncbi:MAG TPA: hypothetical protein VN281_08970, partial [Verrucomicrobiae bacterium]|nr:hypothetical protein [Verrucomicrobiae bacterium]
YYDNVRRDAIAATKRVYEHFDWKLEPQVEQKMRTTLAEQNSRSNGVHRYSAAYFQLKGLNGFTEYCTRFGLTPPEIVQSTKRAEATA